MGKKGEEFNIKDKGGTRSGQDRRQNHQPYGLDRRSGLARRRISDRRSENGCWDGSMIERRDMFRKNDIGSS